MVMVLQALDLVVADEFQSLDVFSVPAGAVHANFEGTGIVGCRDASRDAGTKLSFLPHKPNHAFQGLIVEV